MARELEALLIDFAKTEEQHKQLLDLQERVITHDAKVLKYMDKTKIDKPLRSEESAFKHLEAVIEYCEQFTEPEAYEAIEALKAVKLPLATSERYKTQQMITDMKNDWRKYLQRHGFTNIERITTALLQLAKHYQ